MLLQTQLMEVFEHLIKIKYAYGSTIAKKYTSNNVEGMVEQLEELILPSAGLQFVRRWNSFQNKLRRAFDYFAVSNYNHVRNPFLSSKLFLQS